MTNIIDIIVRTDKRRVRGDELVKHKFNRPNWPSKDEGHDLLRWIDTNTSGRFILSKYAVGFVDEKDAVIFSLWWEF